MWKRWLNLPAVWRQRLRRFALASLAVAGLASVAWWLVDQRLAAEARRQADAGLSFAVADVRRDWTEVILPTAISGEAAAADRAREVAAARIDRAVSAAGGGQTAALRETVSAALAGVRELDTPPTDEGALWAEWLIRRLTGGLSTLSLEDRVALLIEADDTLAVLASRTRRRETEPSPVEPIAPPLTPEPETPLATTAEPQHATASPAPAPQRQTPPAPPEPLKPEPLKIVATPRARAAAPQPQSLPREPEVWSPDWRHVEPTEPLTEETPPLPRTLADQADRELLAAYVRLADALSAEQETASASGPTRAPSSEPELRSETEVRLEAIGTELSSRGFRAVDRRHLDALLSPHAARRVALAERLLTAQTGDTARLLLVLAEDTSPEVRAAAISALGSSASRPLVRAAWELASQDQDPRVGRLAEPLRQRLR
ncbi:hypothetical protein MalM25_09570 [Planctomycetes bacterium MalM25]|nr:hypothetical protein MalM25_09570 [Planctomycetes bacterium MalM25]